MENIISVFEVQARASGIDLKLIWDQNTRDDTCIRADPTRLNQIIVNLLSNSLRFLETSENRRSCFLRVAVCEERPPFGPPATAQDASWTWLVVTVEDTGM